MKKLETKDRIAKYLLTLFYLTVPGLLFFAPFYDGDYSFFQLLRGVTFIFCGYFAIITLFADDGYSANRNSKYPLIFGIIAIIFNPIIPIHLNRELWAFIDFAAGSFLIFYFIERKAAHKKQREKRLRNK